MRVVRHLGVAMLVAVIASGCGGSEDGAAPTVGTPLATVTTAGRPPAPPLSGTTIDGESIALSDFQGRPVLINVWSSWWSTCQSEAVAYAQFQRENPELGYLGINVADSAEEASAFVDRYGWTWPSIRDPERSRARSIGATYQPHVVLVDADGGIVDSWEGGGDTKIWGQMVAKLP